MYKMFSVFFIAAIALNAWATEMIDFGGKHFIPSEDVVSPHITWLKPSQAGKLKVLFITSRGGLREVIELAQRMDMAYTVFATTSQKEFYTEEYACDHCDKQGFKKNYQARIQDFNTKIGGDYDVIVLGRAWGALPLEQKYLLLKKVKEGAPLFGLVDDPPADDYWKKAVRKKSKADIHFLFPFKGLAQFKNSPDFPALIAKTVEVSSFGKGRMVMLKNYNVGWDLALTPVPSGSLLEAKDVELDYYMAYLCHLIAATAGKTAGVKLAGKDYLKTDRANPAPLEISLAADNKQKVTCEFILRNTDNEIVFSDKKDIKLAPGENKASLVFGPVPAGQYFADIWVKHGAAILDSGSAFVEVTSPLNWSNIGLNKSFRKNEPVNGRITLTNAGTEAAQAEIRVEQRDTYGRTVARITVPAENIPANGQKEMNFTLPATKPLTIVQYLVLELRRDGIVLAKERRPFSISDLRPKEDIRYIVWTGNSSYFHKSFYKEIAQAGFDTQYTGFDGAAPIANLFHINYATRWNDEASDFYPHPKVPPRARDDHVRLPCLNDPQYRQKEIAKFTNGVDKVRPFSGFEFSMGDECHFVYGNYEVCFCSNCVPKFHAWLKDEYKTLEALNQEYDANYAAFDEIKPVTLAEAQKDRKLIPLWVDFRRCMEAQWSDMYQFAGDIIRKEIPDARVGDEGNYGGVNSFQAMDFYRWMQIIDMNGAYDRSFVPYMLSDFRKPGALIGLGWYGGYSGTQCAEYSRYIPWRHLFRGANSYWVWMIATYSYGSVMAPDFSFYEFFKPNIREVGEIKQGIGKLMMNARRVSDDTAVLYSPSSVHAATLTGGLPQMDKVLDSLAPLLEDSGFQFQVVSYRQLADGVLAKDGFKRLLLPYAQALSRQELDQISAFVKNGGMVIADLRPGVCDEHGKPYPQGALDELFGVKQNPLEARIKKDVPALKLENFSEKFPATYTDAGLELTTGKSMGAIAGAPVLIVNKAGNGTAVLINMSLTGYGETSGELEKVKFKATPDALAIRAFWKALMAKLGVKPRIEFEPDVFGMRSYRFAAGDCTYLGILQEPPEPYKNYAVKTASPLKAEKCKIKLPEKRHVYNAREGKYLGVTDVIETEVTPTYAQFYSLLPYQVTKLELSMPAKVRQGDTLACQVELCADAPKVGLHIIHISLINPQGQALSGYADNVKTVDGKVQVSIPLALNEVPGEWRLTAKDAATGIKAGKKFKVVPVD